MITDCASAIQAKMLTSELQYLANELKACGVTGVVYSGL